MMESHFVLFAASILLHVLTGNAGDLVVPSLGGGHVGTRKGCREVITCTVTGPSPPEWTRGEIGLTAEVSDTTQGGVTVWTSNITLNSVEESDRGVYTCAYGTESMSLILGVEEALISITVAGVDISDMEYGAEFVVNCTVQTCVSDIVIQLFTEDQLVESTTVQERTRLVASARLKATEEVLGSYTCQAQSEFENQVIRETFEIIGIPGTGS